MCFPDLPLLIARCASLARLRPLPRNLSSLPLWFALVLPALVGACQSPGGPLSEMAGPINATLEPNTVVLAVGDQLEVRFPNLPTWNQEVEIAPDGSASFLSIGRLTVAGMSPGKLNQTLTESYARIFESGSEVNVQVKTLGARNVYVMGEVLKPGEFALDPSRRLTFVEALARAGGPRKESAALASAMLVRWSVGTGKQLAWKLDARPEQWTGPTPLYLQPYDVVYIPNTPVDEVAIWVDNYIRRMIPFPYLIAPPIR